MDAIHSHSQESSCYNHFPYDHLWHFMKLRSREISVRNSLGKDIGGKSPRDAYSQERVSIFKPIAGDRSFCLADTLTCVARDPFSSTVVHQFEDALTPEEQSVCTAMIAGYPVRDVKKQLGIDQMRYSELQNAVREKAMMYLS
jgi:hypothetical protein